jgi:ABC-2 type transport system ATP-binding protein
MRVDVMDLHRHFGSTRAVDGITFGFASGQIFGFVGPNGAGKTTTLRILATLDEPTGGDVTIDGVSVVEHPERARRLVGFVPDSLPTHRDMTVHEYLDFFARAYGLRNGHRGSTVENVEGFCNLLGIRQKLLHALSKGMKQRVSLARALLHDPPMLLMDEPAAGLDPRARIELRELLRVLAERGKAILISSHILTELAEICDGAVIIERGRLLGAGTLDQLMHHGGGSAVSTVRIRALDDAGVLHRELLEMADVHAAAVIGKCIEVEVPADEQVLADLLAALVRRGHRIIEYRPMTADLEKLFMTVTKGDVQ